MPDEVEFAATTVLAEQVLGRALDAGVPGMWVAADEAYGQDHKFRICGERPQICFVVAVPRSQTVASETGSTRGTPRCRGRT